jgi:hypothetical protein
MKKSYSKFTLEDIQSLGINIVNEAVFTSVNPVSPSDFLIQLLKNYQGIPLTSEKIRSEILITPIINEVRLRNPKKITFFSGCQLNVDAKRGLNGFCDFIISGKYNAAFVEKPLIAIVEAKHNQALLDAAPQCIAEMYAAQLVNEKDNQPQPVIFGAITNGYEWIFLKLEAMQVCIDIDYYNSKNLAELLGIWQTIVDSF